jgi:hypothetical protein
MVPPPRPHEWFDPSILAPHFWPCVTNCLAEADAAFLRGQLDRHHFEVVELDGALMHDRHGFFLVLRRAFDLPPDLPARPDDLPAFLRDALAPRAAQRICLLVRSAEVLLAADLSLFLLLVRSVEAAAGFLSGLAPPRQVLLFFAGATDAFPPIDAPARRRAESHRGVKVTADELALAAWTAPRDFPLGPQHQFTLSPAAWYYLSAGHRSRGPDEPWHCVEQADQLTFARGDTAQPCLAGLFARVRGGMQLVGLRYESDPSVFFIPSVSEDPFTRFRGICQQLAVWQSLPDVP